MPRKKTEAKLIPSKVLTESPSKAIRLKCLDCQGEQRGEVRNCASDDCPLWPFRLGKNPFSKRGQHTSEENKKLRSERMKAKWTAKKSQTSGQV